MIGTGAGVITECHTSEITCESTQLELNLPAGRHYTLIKTLTERSLLP